MRGWFFISFMEIRYYTNSKLCGSLTVVLSTPNPTCPMSSKLKSIVLDCNPDLRASFHAIAGENEESHIAVQHPNGNGFFVPPKPAKRYELDPSLKRHVVLEPISPLDRNVRDRLGNKFLMTYQALIDLLKDPHQIFLESLYASRKITVVETQFIYVISNNRLIAQTFGAVRNAKRWHCANFDYDSKGERLKRRPYILAFVPPRTTPKTVVKR